MSRAFLGALLMSGLVLSGSGCYPTRPSQLQQDVDVLRDQIAQLQRTSAALAAETAELKKIERGNDGNGAGVSARIASLESRMGEVQEMLVDTRQRVDEIAVELRITQDLATSAQPPRLSPSQPPGEAGSEAKRSTLDSSRPPDGEGEMAGRSVAEPVVPLAGEEVYREASLEFARGNYPEAVRGFERFLEQNPGSRRAGDAEYWIAESWFAQRDFEMATARFEQVIQKYPEGDRVIPSLLKKGLSLLELDRTAEAVVVLQHLIQTHPTAEESALARGRLRGLGL